MNFISIPSLGNCCHHSHGTGWTRACVPIHNPVTVLAALERVGFERGECPAVGGGEANLPNSALVARDLRHFGEAQDHCYGTAGGDIPEWA